MNRPYGAVDVSANLKGVVPKAATQKILVALAEKGELVQKTYGLFVFIMRDISFVKFFPRIFTLLTTLLLGKTTFFVANQANLETVPPEKLAALEAEYKILEEEKKVRAAEVKVLSGGQCNDDVDSRCIADKGALAATLRQSWPNSKPALPTPN